MDVLSIATHFARRSPVPSFGVSLPRDDVDCRRGAAAPRGDIIELTGIYDAESALIAAVSLAVITRFINVFTLRTPGACKRVSSSVGSKVNMTCDVTA